MCEYKRECESEDDGEGEYGEDEWEGKCEEEEG